MYVTSLFILFGGVSPQTFKFPDHTNFVANFTDDFQSIYRQARINSIFIDKIGDPPPARHSPGSILNYPRSELSEVYWRSTKEL